MGHREVSSDGPPPSVSLEVTTPETPGGMFERSGVDTVVSGSERLASAVKRFNAARRSGVNVDERPGCVYGIMTRDGVEDLACEMERLRKSVENTNKILVGLLVSIALASVGLVLRGIAG